MGEFGYELFNWQGKVKKFYKTLGEGEIIVCAGRRGLDIIYPYAKYYQDLSDLEFFRTSHSCVYWMIPRNCKGSRGEDCTCSTCCTCCGGCSGRAIRLSVYTVFNLICLLLCYGATK